MQSSNTTPEINGRNYEEAYQAVIGALRLFIMGVSCTICMQKADVAP
jgi:hypothetical protein